MIRMLTPGPWAWTENALQAGDPCNRTNVISIRTDAEGRPYLSVSDADRAAVQTVPEMLRALRQARACLMATDRPEAWKANRSAALAALNDLLGRVDGK